jgi:hypothetical protein
MFFVSINKSIIKSVFKNFVCDENFFYNILHKDSSHDFTESDWKPINDLCVACAFKRLNKQFENSKYIIFIA